METTDTPTINSSEQFIETGLKKFEESEITKEGLIALADSVKDLVIKDAFDRAGAKAVEDARKRLKKQRTAIKKTADDIRETAKRFNQAVIAREKELVVLIEPTELLLEQRETDWYAERERIRQEEERKESERIQNMLDQLNALNYAIDFHQLKALTDEQFQEILVDAKQKFEEAKLAKEERERKQRVEEERLAELRKQDEERLETLRQEQEQVRLENERKQKEFEEQQQKFREEQERIRIENEQKAKELADRQAKLDEEENQRLDKIRQSRLKILADFDCTPNVDLAKVTDEKFQKIRNEAEKAFNEEQERIKKEQKEKEAAEERERMRCAEDAVRFNSMHTQLVRVQSTFKDYADLNTSLAGVEASSQILKKISECIEVAKKHIK